MTDDERQLWGAMCLTLTRHMVAIAALRRGQLDACDEAMRTATEAGKMFTDRLAAMMADPLTGLPAGMADHAAAEPTAMACPLCQGINPQGCRVCNGSGVISLGASLDPETAGTIAYKPCGCAAEWWGISTPADHLASRRKAWAEMGYRSEAMAWQDAAPLLTQGASCTHAPPAPDAVKPIAPGSGATTPVIAADA